MQPYFLPHLSYFQLISCTDIFCLHDLVKYTKQSWINRNRIVINGEVQYLTIPVNKYSDFDAIGKKEISLNFDRKLILKTIEFNYKKSPYFKNVFPLISEIINFNSINLFDFIHNSIFHITQYLGLNTKLVRCSDLEYDQTLDKTLMIIDICKKLSSDTYINSVGGRNLYNYLEFAEKGIDLLFLQRLDFFYKNSMGETNSSLSILDTLMWSDLDAIKDSLKNIIFVSGS
jgi:hypothetical protein